MVNTLNAIVRVGSALCKVIEVSALLPRICSNAFPNHVFFIASSENGADIDLDADIFR